MFGLKGLQFWMGYEASYNDARTMEAKAATLDQATAVASMRAQADESRAAGQEQMPRLYSRNGDVGVIAIKGSLINTENWMTQFLGMTTYPAIQEAAAFAAMDPKVSKILLDVGSGGGQVSGVESTVAMLRQLGGIKPMTAYSDSLIGSAAYWLAATAKNIYVGETTIVGSIGAAMVHTSVAEALKKEGTAVTVIRSGEFKMLGHPAEPLSKAALDHFQAMIDKTAGIFEASVAKDRGMSAELVKKVATGQEYLGADAHAAGLVDGILSISDVFAKMDEKKKVDNFTTPNNNRSQQIRGSTMTRAVLTQKQMAAAIAAGANAEALATSNAEAEAANAALALLTPEQIADAAKVVADAAAAEAAVAAETAAAELAKVEAKDAPVVNAQTVEIDLLNKQIAALNATVVDLKVAAQANEAKYNVDSAALEALRKIGCDSINKMTVALSGTAAAVDTLSSAEVVARHAEISATFCEKFKVGGVAAVVITEKVVTKKTNVSSLDQARVNAAKIGGSK